MLFRPDLAPKAVKGTKTNTRRIVKANETLVMVNGKATVIQRDYLGRPRIKWQVGRTYAVQPGRGKRGIGRVEVTGISREHLQDITEAGAIAEGVDSRWLGVLFYRDYLADHRREALGNGRWKFETARASFRSLWDSIHKNAPGHRFKDDPEVWRLVIRPAAE